MTPTNFLAVGEHLPNVTLESADGPIEIEVIRNGRPLIVTFYLEDQTPICTAQLNALEADLGLIEQLGANLIAISSDSIKSHEEFSKKENFTFMLLTDKNLEAARRFGVLDEGEQRCRRAVFVTNRDGKIVEAIPHYNPGNSSQYQAIFAALGMNLS
jgi:peroxiredoxin Q/BCP